MSYQTVSVIAYVAFIVMVCIVAVGIEKWFQHIVDDEASGYEEEDDDCSHP